MGSEIIVGRNVLNQLRLLLDGPRQKSKLWLMVVEDLTLLAVFAHPDDEAFGTGGTLARYAAEGCDVYLVTARAQARRGRSPCPRWPPPPTCRRARARACAAPARPTASMLPSFSTTWTANCPSFTRARPWASWSRSFASSSHRS